MAKRRRDSDSDAESEAYSDSEPADSGAEDPDAGSEPDSDHDFFASLRAPEPQPEQKGDFDPDCEPQLASPVDSMMAELEPERLHELDELCGFRSLSMMNLNQWRERVQSLSNSDLRELISRFYAYMGGAGELDLHQVADRLFPRGRCNDLVALAFHQRWLEIRLLYINSCVDFRKSDQTVSCADAIVPEEASLSLILTEEDLGKLAAIHGKINAAAQYVRALLEYNSCSHPRFHPVHALTDTHYVVSREDFMYLLPNKQALLWIMHCALKDSACLVIVEGRTERSVYFPRNYNGFFTHTYVPFRVLHPVGAQANSERLAEKASTVTEYIHHVADNPLTAGHGFSILLSTTSTVNYVAQVLNNGQNPAIPVLVPDRHVFSFTNGVYDAAANKFYYYDNPASPPPPRELMAVKFFESEFQPWSDKDGPFYRGGVVAEHDDEMPDAKDDWFDIPTPNFDRLFRTQITNDENASYRTEDPELALRFNWAFLGRLLFDVGERDNLQRTYGIIGGAGCGKSVVSDILNAIYPAHEVRVTGDNHEERFGLAALYGGLLWMIKECGKNSSFTLSDFLSMSCGEELPIRVKHETAFSERWSSPGCFFGNGFFSKWLEEPERLSAIIRRLIYLRFLNPVPSVDPDLKARCLDERPQIILKMSRAYFRFVEYCRANPERTGDLRNWWPSYFEDSLNSLVVSLNALRAFILDAGLRFVGSAEPAAIRAEFCIPWSIFRDNYKAFCTRNPEYKELPINPEQLPDMLRDRGVFTRTVDDVNKYYPQPADPDAHLAKLKSGEIRPRGGVANSSSSSGSRSNRRRPKRAAAGASEGRSSDQIVLCGIIDRSARRVSEPVDSQSEPGNCSAAAAPGFVAASNSPPPAQPALSVAKLLERINGSYISDEVGGRRLKPEITRPVAQSICTAIGIALSSGAPTPEQRTRLEAERRVWSEWRDRAPARSSQSPRVPPAAAPAAEQPPRPISL